MERKKAVIDHAYYDRKIIDERKWEVVLDSGSFKSKNMFDKQWNMFYPWGTDHNGTARMRKNQVDLNNNILKLTAVPSTNNEGKSKSDPHYDIRYYSGAVHARHKITVTEEYPVYRISGEFKAPIKKGTWPAFWLTAVNGWPPEIDILEFKGNSTNWMNTFITPENCTTLKKNIPDASANWHQYSVELKRIDDINTVVSYFLDGEKIGDHWTNFTNHPMWLIINLQMEGSSGTANKLENTEYLARNISIKRLKKQ